VRTTRAVLPVISVMILALAACGDDSNEGSGGKDQNQNQETLLKYAKCMRDNGVQVPDPAGDKPSSIYDGVDQNSAAFKAADKVCSPLLKGIVEGRKNDQGDTDAEQQKLLTLAKCLRQHGVDVQDPVPGAEKPFGQSLDRTDPATAKALAACGAGQG
jgi:hypothetical protein